MKTLNMVQIVGTAVATPDLHRMDGGGARLSLVVETEHSYKSASGITFTEKHRIAVRAYAFAALEGAALRAGDWCLVIGHICSGGHEDRQGRHEHSWVAATRIAPLAPEEVADRDDT